MIFQQVPVLRYRSSRPHLAECRTSRLCRDLAARFRCKVSCQVRCLFYPELFLDLPADMKRRKITISATNNQKNSVNKHSSIPQRKIAAFVVLFTKSPKVAAESNKLCSWLRFCCLLQSQGTSSLHAQKLEKFFNVNLSACFPSFCLIWMFVFRCHSRPYSEKAYFVVLIHVSGKSAGTNSLRTTSHGVGSLEKSIFCTTCLIMRDCHPKRWRGREHHDFG